MEVQDAIVRHNKETDPYVRNQIYNESIRFAFEKLAENIIHTFKFYYFDVPSEDVKHEVVSCRTVVQYYWECHKKHHTGVCVCVCVRKLEEHKCTRVG